MKITNLSIIGLLLVAGLLTACSNTKKSAVSQTYHNITARFNSYFNANERMKIVLNNLDEGHNDNYDEIINLYPYGTPEEAQAYSADLTAVFDKASFSIQAHEPSRWADDAFMLIGKKYYLEGDYESAINTFSYITSEYKDGYKEEFYDAKDKKDKKKKKKKKTKTDKDGNVIVEDDRPTEGWGHHPAYNEALVWLVMSYTQLEQYKEASTIVTLIEANDEFPTNYDDEFFKARAFYYLHQDEYVLALEPLEESITATKKKKERARPFFVLAQLNEELKDYPKALETYQLVLKSNPDYEMAFAAKMKIAKVTLKGGGSLSESEKMLAKMAKDGKNEEYLDQIYFEMAQIAYSQGDRNKAIGLYKKSAASSVGNNDQKAMSYLRIAEIYFDEEKYPNSKLYYDSTMTVLSGDYEGYDEIEETADILSRLVKEIQIIEMEDSLQTLASLPEGERNQRLEELLAEKKEQEEAQEEKSQNLTEGPKTKDPVSFSSTSTFYFYNQALRNQGYNKFKQVWGDRPLEEDWRRSNKNSFGGETVDDGDDGDGGGSGTDGPQLSTDVDAFAAQLPTSPEKLQKSNERIVEAYYSLAYIYREDLENNRKAIATLEEMNNRFPDNKYQLEAYYNLYLLNNREGNKTKADFYKNIILGQYSDSKFADIINNPNYLDESMAEEKKLEDYYQQTYQHYQNGNYQKVLDREESANGMFAVNDLKPQFALLSAMALSKMHEYEALMKKLGEIITKYPGTPVKEQATEMLLYLEESELPTNIKERLEEEKANIQAAEEAAEEVAEVSQPEEAAEEATEEAAENPGEEETPGEATEVENPEEAVEEVPETPVLTEVPESEIPDKSDFYNNSTKGPHNVIVALMDSSLNAQDYLTKVEAYNKASDQNYNVEIIEIDNMLRLLQIKTFANGNSALEYYEGMEADGSVVDGLQKPQYRVSVISYSNLNKLKEDKDARAYHKFFLKNYFE